MIRKLITHDGRFHADEVLSSVVLRGLYPHAEIIRTRDAGIITPGFSKIVYDVGGLHDPEQMIFDHHQPGALQREDGITYSSFGLVWGHFGRAWLSKVAKINAIDVEDVWTGVDRGLVRSVDAADNGVSLKNAGGPLDITLLIESFAPPFDAPDPDISIDTAFFEVLDVMSTVFSRHVNNVSARVRATRIVSEILETREPGPVLELPYGMPWAGAVRRAAAEDILFVVAPRRDAWEISTVRTGPSGFENRMDFPEAWAGLSGEALVETSGVPGLRFAHAKRFFAVADTRKAALEAISEAIRISYEVSPATNP